MSKKLKITVSVEDDNGEVIATKTSERSVPYINEVEEQGFRAAFHELETAVLEGRKEASDVVVSEYLAEMSQKKPELKRIWEEL
jgi:hypothetical protein